MKRVHSKYFSVLVLMALAFPASAFALAESDLINLAQSLYNQGRYQGTEIACRRILEKQASNAQAFKLLINTALQEKNYKKAVTYSKNGLRLIQKDPELFFLAAYAYDLSGMIKESNKLYQEAYKLNPGKDAYVLGMVRSLCREGKAKEAVQLILAAARKRNNSIDLWEGLMEASLDAEDPAHCRLGMANVSALIHAGNMESNVPKETLVRAIWRLISLDPWDKKSYPEAMKLLVLLDRGIDALKLNEFVSRKFQTDAELYAQLEKCISTYSDPKGSAVYQKAWSSVAKLCRTQERDARRMFAAESKSKLSHKDVSNL